MIYHETVEDVDGDEFTCMGFDFRAINLIIAKKLSKNRTLAITS
jgi:hypothetical protein